MSTCPHVNVSCCPDPHDTSLIRYPALLLSLRSLRYAIIPVVSLRLGRQGGRQGGQGRGLMTPFDCSPPFLFRLFHFFKVTLNFQFPGQNSDTLF